MARGTGIGWTEETWNPLTGCDKISPGCDHCYALDRAAELKLDGAKAYQNDGDPRTSGPGFGLTMHPDRLDQPVRWTRPRMIFVNSMSDFFHPKVTEDFIFEMMKVMAEADHHTYQILTKRSARMAQMAPYIDWPDNVWMGVSVETNKYAYRAERLLDTDGPKVKFVSAEPLLGPLDEMPLEGMDWLIVGGESGPFHRPMDNEWACDLRDRCLDLDIPFYFKQWGGNVSWEGGCELEGTEHKEMPFGIVLK